MMAPEPCFSEIQTPSAVEIIEKVTVEECIRQYGPRVHSIVLTGSLARGEGSFTSSKGFWNVRGDAEFIVVLSNRKSKDADSPLKLARIISSSLKDYSVRCEVTISPVTMSYLSTLTPHIFGYELRCCGRVLWGDWDVLQSIPDFPGSAIPLQDAWRMLNNRLIEYLDAIANAAADPVSDNTVRYRTLKLYLDMGTSFLLFIGKYKPTYLERCREMQTVTADLLCDLAIPDFAHKVQLATNIKLHCQEAVESEFWSRREWQQVVRDAKKLLEWEFEQLQRRSEDECGPNVRENLQGAPMSRILGWSYVFRKASAWDTIRHLGRWIRLALAASPRTLIYMSGRELLFALIEGGEANLQLCSGRSRARLPLVTRGKNLAWQHVASEIVDNYDRFVKSTRL